MHILLIGPRASGKTTVGQALAQRLARSLIDLDDVVLASFDEETVTEVWAVYGESAWREVEVSALQQVLQSEPTIVALGGGTPIIPTARELIEHCRQTGQAKVIYLQCDPAELTHRLQQEEGDRPSLTGKDPVEEIAEVLQEREPVYLELADVVLDAGHHTPDKLAEQLIQNYLLDETIGLD